VLAAIDRHTHDRQWGFLGERAVNVLELNIDLDHLAAASK
jgi:K+-transporting ATPase c subunit